MESNKVAILEKRLPLRNYPEKELDNMLSTVFKFWLANLLSIKADNEEKVDNALPSIKKHFWSLGVKEIKKVFTMYADGELNIKPISNHLDRILVGQIFEAYKNQKPRKKSSQHYTSPDEIEFIMTEAVDRIQKDYEQNGKITEMCHHVYDHLFEKGVLPKHTTQYKTEIQTRAIEIYERKLIEDEEMMQEIISNFSDSQMSELKNLKKRLVLEDYFKLIQNTNN